MSWALAILAAIAAFAVAIAAFRLPRATWTSLAAALLFGLAGYTLQARPDVPAAPASTAQEAYQDEWQMLESRRLLVGDARPRGNHLLAADAYASRGRFTDAAGFLGNALVEDPQDFEAWLALGNVLTEQADGILTQAAVFAYGRANSLRPDHPAPAYFLGLSLIRQGRLMEARQVWRGALAQMEAEPQDEAYAFMADRVGRLEDMLSSAGALPPGEAPAE